MAGYFSPQSKAPARTTSRGIGQRADPLTSYTFARTPNFQIDEDTMDITMAQIERQRGQVRRAYANEGFHSAAYHNSFAVLHGMNMQFMAEQFRRTWGLPPHARTPYC
jgi:hypothetical protein